MAMSPWGIIDHVENFEHGVSFVSTPDHGGLRVSKGYAEKNLSEAARKVAILRPDNYFFFEEDCDWAVAALELPQLWSEFFKYSHQIIGGTRERQRKYLERIVKHWNPEYFKTYNTVPVINWTFESWSEALNN